MAIQPVGQSIYDTRFEAGASAAIASDERRTWLMNHASWGAILAGVVAALLTQLLLSLLGLGISLAAIQVTSDAAGGGASVGGLSVLAALWWVGSGLVAAFVGGLVAGRLSGSARHSTAAWHGFVAWCATTLLTVWLLGSALGGILGGAMAPVGHVLGGLAHAAGGGVVAASGSGGDDLAAQVRSLVNPNDPQTVQGGILAYVRASASGDKPAADAARQQAVDGLARVANISPDEAQNRLNQLQQKYQQTAQQAKQAAEAARHDAARGALFAFAALLLAGIASIVGGGLGTPRRALPGIL